LSQFETKESGHINGWIGKKIMNALRNMPKVEDVCSFILHFEGEEVFGSSKYKLEILIGSEGDSHRLDKVNFSYP